MTKQNYAGRHRAPRLYPVPRLAGTGFLLPTVATATIVLTTTGAHLGATRAPEVAPARVGSAASR
ncbi:MAG: hypothetical protein M3Y71_09590 [Actinomycetota bacterium]|nr:hypothetical protein [Actinomycetota bacterium]